MKTPFSPGACLAVLLLLGGCRSEPAPNPSPTASAVTRSYLEQADAHYQGGRFQESSSAALLAVEDTKTDPAANLKARCLLALSEAKLGSPPLAELKVLSQSQQLSASDRQRVQEQLQQLKTRGLAFFKSARQAQGRKKFPEAIAEGEKALQLFSQLDITEYDGDLMMLLSGCYRATGNASKAQDFLEKAARTNPAARKMLRQAAARTTQSSSIASRPVRSLRTDSKGNSIVGSDGGLTLGISTEGYVLLSIEGTSRNAEMYLPRKEWNDFKANYLEMLQGLKRFQGGGGSSRTVAYTDTDDLVLCAGTVLSSHGWQTRSSRPVLEVWVCTKLSDNFTPWRARPYALPELMKLVDAYLAQIPKIP